MTTELLIAPEHLWPGAEIPFPLPSGGISITFNNFFIKDLPPDTAPEHPNESPNNDFSRPASVSLGWDVVWRFTGEGRWVDIFVRGLTSDVGPAAILYEAVSGSEYVVAPMAENGSPYGGAGIAQIGGNPVAALRVFLKSGIDYGLAIDNAWSQALSDASGYPHGYGGFDNTFYLELSYTPTALPDLRSNAWDVIIPEDGGTYTSPPVLNTTFTSSDEDDPQGAAGAWGTAWWKYERTANTDVTVSFAIVPEELTHYSCTVFRQNTDSTLTALSNGSSPPETFTVPAALLNLNDVLLIQIGTLDYYNDHQPFAQKYQLQVTGARSVVQAPDNPDPTPDPDDPDPWNSNDDPAPDHYVPNQIVPAETDDGSSTLLDLVRAFSTAVHRAVRITGPTTIEMVDPSVPLPPGWANTDAAGMYTTTVRSAAASTQVLSVRAGDVKVDASAQVKANDMRIVLSSWRIPNRLPVYGLPAAPVQRITYTFSPTGFEASVDFHFAAVPIEARRI